MTVDLKPLATRPVPTRGAPDPFAALVHPDPLTASELLASVEADRRYARRRAGQAAGMLRALFPNAHQVVFDREPDVERGLHVTLLTIRDPAGALLWHHAGLAAHPDAVALAEREAYGGPVRPRIDGETLAAIELVIAEADAMPHGLFGSVDEPSLADLAAEPVDLHELIVPQALADLDALAAGDRSGTPPAVLLAAIRGVLVASPDWNADTFQAIDHLFAEAGQPLTNDQRHGEHG